MHREDTHTEAELSRLLIAADPSVDPHRLVGFCCELAAADALTVSLLVPADEQSAARSEGSARAVRLLGHAATLLDAAGIRLEDVMVGEDDGREVDELVRLGGFDSVLVCAPRERAPSPGLSLAVQSAGEHGVTVLGRARQAGGHPRWLKRVFHALRHGPRLGEPAA
jgi:nucleotide-binding universal stress UspA family protein